MRLLSTSILLCLAVASARGDIVEWRDADGVRHFTNVIDEVPVEVRDETRVVARERGDAVAVATTSAAVPPAPDAAPRQAQVVYDPSHLAQIYQDGVAAGRRAQQPAREPLASPVQVIAPIAIAGALPLPAYPPYYYDPYPRSYFWAGLPRGPQRPAAPRSVDKNDCRWPQPCARGARQHFPNAVGPTRGVSLY